jgi:hypothetical protein
MKRVKDLADPARCQGSSKDGQCRNLVEPGSKYCKCHGGRSNAEEQEMRGYLLAKADEQTRLTNLSDSLEPVKELRDTIALLHMLIEKRYNSAKTDTELLQACGPLNTMFLSMERLISSSHKIEQDLGQLLAKNAILSLAKQMVEIIIEELKGIKDYEAIVDRITSRIITTVGGAGQPTLPSA